MFLRNPTFTLQEKDYLFLFCSADSIAQSYNAVLQVCKLFRHIATTEPLVITAEHNEYVLRNIGEMVSQTENGLTMGLPTFIYINKTNKK